MDSYEKRYKEALAHAREIHRNEVEKRRDMEFIFPELAESEDERIRKEILCFLKTNNAWNKEWITWLEKQGEKLPVGFYYVNSEGKKFYSDTFKYGDVILHVEKQGKQKPDDKVESKFKVGDWVVDKNGTVHQILSYKDCIYKHTNGYSSRMFEDEGRLWDITKDAKDGDMLVNGSNIFIFHFINGTRLMGYCHVNTDDGRFYDDLGKNECFCLIDAIVTPATKEQRELLFSKMEEAGYEWDSEKKELKKIDMQELIEQKSTWTEKDEETLKSVIATCELAEQDRVSSPAKHLLETQLNWLKALKQRMTRQ